MTLLEMRAHRKPLAILLIVALVAIELHAIYHDRAVQQAENTAAQERIQKQFEATIKDVEQDLQQSRQVLLNIVGDSFPYVVPYVEGMTIYPRTYNDGRYALNGVTATITHRRPSAPEMASGNILANIGMLAGGSYSTYLQPLSIGGAEDTYTIYLNTMAGMLTEALQMRRAPQSPYLQYRFWIARGSHVSEEPELEPNDTLIGQRDWVDAPATNPQAASPPSPAPQASPPGR